MRAHTYAHAYKMQILISTCVLFNVLLNNSIYVQYSDLFLSVCRMFYIQTCL